MKLARLAMAILSVAVFAACSADLTGPDTNAPSFTDTYGSTGANGDSGTGGP